MAAGRQLRREASLEKKIWCQTMTAADKSHCMAAGRQKRGLAKKLILNFSPIWLHLEPGSIYLDTDALHIAFLHTEPAGEL
jgi:hypothetical protein